MQGYTAPTLLEGVAKDLDVRPENQTQGIAVGWSCTNMNTNATCKDIMGEDVQLNSSNSLSYPPKIFQPYTVFQFTFEANKSSTG